MAAQTNAAGVDTSTPPTTSAASIVQPARRAGSRTTRSADQTSSSVTRASRGVRLELGGVAQQAGGGGGEAERQERLELGQGLAREGNEGEQEGARGQEGNGAEGQLGRAGGNDGGALEPQKGDRRELAVVEGVQQAPERAAHDARGEHRLVAPQRVAPQVPDEPEHEARAQRGREQPRRYPVGKRSSHPWSSCWVVPRCGAGAASPRASGAAKAGRGAFGRRLKRVMCHSAARPSRHPIFFPSS